MWWKRGIILPGSEDRPHILVEIAILSLILLVLLGLSSDAKPLTEIGGTPDLLTTLAIIQSSILAIVFSVTLLGVQLIGTRYTLQAADLFIKDRVLISILGLYIVSISIDLYLIYILPPIQGPIYTAGVYFAWGLALIAIAGLFAAVWRTIRRSTPQGIASTLAGQVDLQDGVALGKNSNTGHPLRDLYSLSISSINNDDRLAAQAVFNEYVRLIEQSRSNVGSDIVIEKTNSLDTFFRECLTEQMSDIISTSFKANSIELLQEVISCQRLIGERALIDNRTSIVEFSFRGLVNTLKNNKSATDVSELHPRIYNNILHLLASSIKTQNYAFASRSMQELVEIDSTFDQDSRLSIEKETYNIYFNNLSTIIIYISIISRGGIENENFRFRVDEKGIRKDATGCLHQWLRLLISVTTSYITSGDGSKYDEVEYVNCWQESGIRIGRMPNRTFTTQFYKVMIEIAVLDICNSSNKTESSKIRWCDAFANIRDAGASSTLDGAFNDVNDDIEHKSGIRRAQENTDTKLDTISEEIQRPKDEVTNLIVELQRNSRESYSELVWSRESPGEIRSIVMANPKTIGLGDFLVRYPAMYGPESLLEHSPDSILTQTIQGPVFVKFIKSLEPESASMIRQLKQDLQEELATKGENLSFIVVSPSIDLETKYALQILDIESAQFDPTPALENNQMALSEFQLPDHPIYTSKSI